MENELLDRIVKKPTYKTDVYTQRNIAGPIIDRNFILNQGIAIANLGILLPIKDSFKDAIYSVTKNGGTIASGNDYAALYILDLSSNLTRRNSFANGMFIREGGLYIPQKFMDQFRLSNPNIELSQRYMVGESMVLDNVIDAVIKTSKNVQSPNSHEAYVKNVLSSDSVVQKNPVAIRSEDIGRMTIEKAFSDNMLVRSLFSNYIEKFPELLLKDGAKDVYVNMNDDEYLNSQLYPFAGQFLIYRFGSTLNITGTYQNFGIKRQLLAKFPFEIQPAVSVELSEDKNNHLHHPTKKSRKPKKMSVTERKNSYHARPHGEPHVDDV